MKKPIATKIIVMCLPLVIAIACSVSDAAQVESVLSPSELVAYPEKYDGKHVHVRGYIVVGPEKRNIFDSLAGYNDPHGACLGLDAPDKKFMNFHMRYTRNISGIFRRKLCRDGEICLYWCGSSGIELDKTSRP